MDAIHVSKLLHYYGFGLVCTVLFAGWILNGRYRKAEDYKTKAHILRLLRPIVLFSPASIVILTLSGIGNMTLGYRQYTLFSDAWLSVKMLFFVVAAGAGVFMGLQSARRAKLVAQRAEESGNDTLETTIAALDKQQRLLYLFQFAILLVILILSIVQPR